MQKLEVLDTHNIKECGDFCYDHCVPCRMCQKRECWLIISPILLLVFGGIVVEIYVKMTVVRVLVWVSASLNLIIVFTTMIPGWEYIWLYISKCLRHIFCFCCRRIRKYERQERIAHNDPAPDINLTKCPPCCPCAFWPTPYQYCGTECASCVNIILNIIFAVICLLLILWKNALKADYDECMKHSTDCNREHIDHYEGELSSWIIFLVFCILIFNCCVGRNLIYYRISQAAHGDLSIKIDVDEENPSNVHPSTSTEINNNNNNEGIELVRIPNNNGSFHSQNNNNNPHNGSISIPANPTNQTAIEVKEEGKEEVKEDNIPANSENKENKMTEEKEKEKEDVKPSTSPVPPI